MFSSGVSGTEHFQMGVLDTNIWVLLHYATSLSTLLMCAIINIYLSTYIYTQLYQILQSIVHIQLYLYDLVISALYWLNCCKQSYWVTTLPQTTILNHKYSLHSIFSIAKTIVQLRWNLFQSSEVTSKTGTIRG